MKNNKVIKNLSSEAIQDLSTIDKEIKTLTTNEYTVWVGGGEVNDEYLTYENAKVLYDEYTNQGYDDVVIERHMGSRK